MLSFTLLNQYGKQSVSLCNLSASVGASADIDSPSEDCDGPVMWEWKSSKGWHRYGTTASDHIGNYYLYQM